MEETMNQMPDLALSAGMIIGLIVLLSWSFAWKGIALWKAARNGSKAWYVVMLLVNTVGFLEIIYIFAVAKKTELAKSDTPPTPMLQK